MTDTSPPDPEKGPSSTSDSTNNGGVQLDAGHDVIVGGDVVGRDKITNVGLTVEQVKTLLEQISSTFQPRPFDGRCPYVGLDYFGEEDADRFFGRETLVTGLVARIKQARFVVIAGPSGSGKSSLVRAGLIHALKQGELPNSDRWLYATLTPGRDPIEALALAMSRLARSPDAGDYVRRHAAETDALHKFAESVLSDRPDQRVVIFVDQFEEVFTQVSQEDERLAYLNLLTHAATHENGRITVLLALRSDFVSNCATCSRLNGLLNRQFMQIGAMQPGELVSAIARPALQVGLRIDPDLVTQIGNDMQDEPGACSTCRRPWGLPFSSAIISPTLLILLQGESPMYRSRLFILMLLCVALLVSACTNAATPSPAPAAPTQPPTAKPTATIAPTPTPKPQPTAIPALAEGAACLVGAEWQLADMSDYFSSVMAQAGGGPKVASQDGSITYVFGKDGVATVEADKFKLTLKVDVQDVALAIVAGIDGRATTHYTLSDPNKVTFSNPQMGNLKFSATLNGTELFSSTPDELAAMFGVSPDPSYSTGTYECSGDTLKYTPPVKGSKALTFKRVP